MKVETQEIPIKPVYKPFKFTVTIESEEEATWFHDYILCRIPNQKPNFKFVKEHRDLVGTFFKQSQEAREIKYEF